MSNDLAEKYEAAMKLLQPHISREPDGTIRLNVESGESLGIDPVVFADLKRSMDWTNDMIKRGDLDPRDVSDF